MAGGRHGLFAANPTVPAMWSERLLRRVRTHRGPVVFLGSPEDGASYLIAALGEPRQTTHEAGAVVVNDPELAAAIQARQEDRMSGGPAARTPRSAGSSARPGFRSKTLAPTSKSCFCHR